jgi:hypothetical protein
MAAEPWTVRAALVVTDLQLCLDKRGCLLLIPKERFVGGVVPPTPVFGKRGCKLLKTKGRSCEKRAKRLQVPEGFRVKARACEVCSR